MNYLFTCSQETTRLSNSKQSKRVAPACCFAPHNLDPASLNFNAGREDDGPPRRELGCSRCRFSATGCSRCRNPSFRPRSALSQSHLTERRQVLAAEKRHHGARLKAQRAEETTLQSEAARGSLIQRLRHHLGSESDEKCGNRPAQPPSAAAGPSAAEPAVAKERARTVTAAALSTPADAIPPPSKYRRVDRRKDTFATAATASHPPPLPPAEQQQQQLSDVEMMDVEEEETAQIINSGRGVASSGERGTQPEGGGEADEGVNARKRRFLDMLEINMDARREARLSGASSPLQELASTPAAKRRKAPNAAAGTPPSSHRGRNPAAAPSHLGQPAGGVYEDPRLPTWEPPVSPYGLLEEELFADPWKLLVSCMLLNKTTAAQVRKVIWPLFELCPTPQAAAAADTAAIEALIQPLGLFRKRAVAVQRLSQEYLIKEWDDPTELYGIGKYAADAYGIFCRGRWQDVKPEDKDLKRYLEWLKSTGGQGTGLTRHLGSSGGSGGGAK